MHPVRGALVVLLVGAGVYAAGCAHGADDLLNDVTGFTDDAGGPSAPSSTIPGADASGTPPLADASPSPDGALDPDADPGDGATTDATPPVDAAPPIDAAPPHDAALPDAGALDQGVGVPGPGGAPCSSIGNEFECNQGEVCRIATPTGGRCEGCTAAHHCRSYGQSCAKSADCSAPLQCFDGQCTYTCRLGKHDCDPLACANVGNTKYGLCR